MKQALLIPLLICSIFISSTTIAQDSTQSKTEQEVKSLLCHKWKLVKMELQGKMMEMPPELGDSFIEFKSDGTLIQTNQGTDEKAKWTYDHKTKTIKSEEKSGIEKQKVIKISETELILEMSFDEAPMKAIMKRVD